MEMVQVVSLASDAKKSTSQNDIEVSKGVCIVRLPWYGTGTSIAF